MGLLFIFLLSIFGSQVQAQSSQDELHLHLGWIMPNQIENVTEIMPQWGLGYSIGNQTYLGDFMVFNANAAGVNWTTFVVGMRFQFSPFDQFYAAINTGLDLSWYIPEGQSSRRTDLGGHVGVQGMMYLAESLWMGTELRFLGGPGTSLYLGFTATLRSKGK